VVRTRITPDNVAGLVVGEGCFYAESAPDPKYRSGWRIRPAFCIEMRADDRPCLEDVKRHLGCGQIYSLDFGRYRGYEERGWMPHAKFRVGRIAELHGRVVPFFRRHPLFGRKAVAFDLFAELVTVLHKRAHRSPEGLLHARRIAEQLQTHNRRGARPAQHL
jgi:hypothetical protein